MNHHPDITVDNNEELKYKLLYWSLCGMFFFIPVAKTPAIVTGIVSLSIWLFSGIAFKHLPLLVKNPRFIPVAVFFILIWMGLIHAEHMSYEMNHVKRSYYWLYAFAVASLPYNRFDAEKLIKAFLYGLTCTAVLSIMQYASIVPMRSHGLPMGLLSGFHHIILSLYLVFGILVLSFYVNRASSRKESLLIVCMMLICFIDLTMVVYGRSGYVAFFLLSPLIIYNLLGKKHILITGVIIIVLMAVFLLSPTVQDRIKHVRDDVAKYSQGNTNTSQGLRIEMWNMSSKLFFKHPIAGNGSSGFQYVWEKNKPYEDAINFQTPHNTFLYVAAAYGVPGVITIAWLVIVLFKSGWSNRDSAVGFSVLSFVLVFFIGSLVNTMILGSAKMAWASVFIGLQGALTQEK